MVFINTLTLHSCCFAGIDHVCFLYENKNITIKLSYMFQSVLNYFVLFHLVSFIFSVSHWRPWKAFVLYKENKDTMEVINLLSKFLSCVCVWDESAAGERGSHTVLASHTEFRVTFSYRRGPDPSNAQDTLLYSALLCRLKVRISSGEIILAQ